MKTSLGLLEVAGLALAVKVADCMVKAADVAITGIERTNGAGWMLVSVTGDVASVNAAITNGAALARLEHGWVADRVIARPAAALERWIISRDASPVPTVATEIRAAPVLPLPVITGAVEPSPGLTDDSSAEPAATPAAGCNLCHDPACPRRKGEPRGACVHYAQRGNV